MAEHATSPCPLPLPVLLLLLLLLMLTLMASAQPTYAAVDTSTAATDQSALWTVQQGAPTRTALPAACYHSLYAFARTLQTAFERESLCHWSAYWRVLRSGPKPPAGPVELIAGGAYASRARGSSDTAHRSVSPSLADLCICTSSISISFVLYSYKAIIKVGHFTVSSISL